MKISISFNEHNQAFVDEIVSEEGDAENLSSTEFDALVATVAVNIEMSVGVQP